MLSLKQFINICMKENLFSEGKFEEFLSKKDEEYEKIQKDWKNIKKTIKFRFSTFFLMKNWRISHKIDKKWWFFRKNQEFIKKTHNGLRKHKKSRKKYYFSKKNQCFIVKKWLKICWIIDFWSKKLRGFKSSKLQNKIRFYYILLRFCVTEILPGFFEDLQKIYKKK